MLSVIQTGLFICYLLIANAFYNLLIGIYLYASLDSYCILKGRHTLNEEF